MCGFVKKLLQKHRLLGDRESSSPQLTTGTANRTRTRGFIIGHFDANGDLQLDQQKVAQRLSEANPKADDVDSG